jgi:hypothetical protein
MNSLLAVDAATGASTAQDLHRQIRRANHFGEKARTVAQIAHTGGIYLWAL